VSSFWQPWAVSVPQMIPASSWRTCQTKWGAFHGGVAWFEEDLETQNLGPARGSGVLVRAGPRWLIAQYVLSIPIPNQRFKEVRELLTSPSRASP